MKPEIKIKYGKFLDPIFIGYIKGLKKYKWTVPSQSLVKRRVTIYKKIWAKHGESIVKEMEKCTGMKFRREMIPVYVVSGNPRSFSDPLVISSRYNKDAFIDMLTHELIHCLFVDNKIKFKFVKEIFPDENETVSAHIPVYAIMEQIFRKNNIKFNFTNKYNTSSVNIPYRKAVDIASDIGYKRIISVVKNDLTKYIDTL